MHKKDSEQAQGLFDWEGMGENEGVADGQPRGPGEGHVTASCTTRPLLATVTLGVIALSSDTAWARS